METRQKIKVEANVEGFNNSNAVLFDGNTMSPTFPIEFAKVCKIEGIPLMVRTGEYKGKTLANIANETLLAVLNANYEF